MVVNTMPQEGIEEIRKKVMDAIYEGQKGVLIATGDLLRIVEALEGADQVIKECLRYGMLSTTPK